MHEPPASQPVAVLLLSGGHERAHYAFVLLSAAAAMGRDAVLFATNEGCRTLLRDLAPDARDAVVQAAGVAGLRELREACMDLGVRLLACPAGLLMAGLDPAALAPGVEVAGVPVFLHAARGGTVITL